MAKWVLRKLEIYKHFGIPTHLKQMSLLPFIHRSIHLVRQKAEEGNIAQREWSVRALEYEWNMQLDLDHQITLLLEITTTTTNILAARHCLVVNFCQDGDSGCPMGLRHGGRL